MEGIASLLGGAASLEGKKCGEGAAFTLARRGVASTRLRNFGVRDYFKEML
jgi:hypothetical protein